MGSSLKERFKMKVKLSRKDIIWSYIGTFVTMGANVIMLPFLIYYISIVYYIFFLF